MADKQKIQSRIDAIQKELEVLRKELADRKLRTLITFVVDESSSMLSKRDEVIQGFNDYLAEQKKNTVDEAYISLYKFNGTVSTIYAQKALAEAPNLDRSTYSPNGWTALLDAVNDGVWGAEHGATFDRHLFIVMTDGEENSSFRATKNSIERMIKDRTERGNWTFVYLGANQDAWQIGSQYGFLRGNTMSYDHNKTYGTVMALSAATSGMRGQMTNSMQNFADQTAKNIG